MDFRFTDEQNMIRDLARGILSKEMTPERAKAAEKADAWHDAKLWATLAEAGLLGIAIEEAHGGMGLGFLELCTLFEEIGRAVAPVHALPALVLGGHVISACGSAGQKKAFLPELAAGRIVLTASLDASAVRAERRGTNWVLDGKVELVAATDVCERVLVATKSAGGVGLFLLDPRAAGVELTRCATSRREPLFNIALTDITLGADDLLGGELLTLEALESLRAHAVVAGCALQVGVSAQALETTAAYVGERVQFGVPIGSFQAVQHRLADGYIDVEAMRWVMWRAAWKLARGEDARRETEVAKFWAADAGARVAASAQHLHGGIGVDVDYPIHRYFLWSKALELSFGSGTEHLAALGKDMAASPPSVDS
jgi:alkylation response protein AidB-like acyl-CoA dehydrogenase